MICRVLLALIVVSSCCTRVILAADQFYSNGSSIGGWNEANDTIDPEGQFFWTYHFFKRSPDDLWWTQNVVKKYKNPADPNKRNKLFYYSQPQRVFTGYYDIELGEYASLPRQFRRRKLEDIPLRHFTEPKGMPALYEMGRMNCEPRKVDERELEAPPEIPD